MVQDFKLIHENRTWITLRNIFRYLRKTTSLGFCYPCIFGFFVQVYSDTDLGGCGLDLKITFGGCHFLDGKLVSWHSKKHTCVLFSTAEGEYIVAASCSLHIIWIRSQLR